MPAATAAAIAAAPAMAGVVLDERQAASLPR
jgi:hypothetical protein